MTRNGKRVTVELKETRPLKLELGTNRHAVTTVTRRHLFVRGLPSREPEGIY